MMYRVYLRDSNQQVSNKILAGDQQAAVTAFEALVNQVNLDGQMVMAVITKKGSPIAHHKFNSRPDDTSHFWRGRISQLPIYDVVGRPSEMDGGKRVNVYLDAESIAIASTLGKGNVSDGIRKALKQAEIDASK